MGVGFKKRTGTNNKNLSYLSHEFIIQNHGDIVTCALMVFIIGLMFQITGPLASVFITPKYNITDPEIARSTPMLYTYGLQDIGLVFFYSLASIVFHAVVQEYALDVSLLDIDKQN
jgi:translocating chain-associated membrane protein 1